MGEKLRSRLTIVAGVDQNKYGTSASLATYSVVLNG